MRSSVIAIALIVVGMLLLLSNLHVLSLHVGNQVLRTWWPMILVVLGAWGLVGKG